MSNKVISINKNFKKAKKAKRKELKDRQKNDVSVSAHILTRAKSRLGENGQKTNTRRKASIDEWEREAKQFIKQEQKDKLQLTIIWN